MARIKVTDPEGSEWRVWRRWYAWRRLVTLGDIWKALPGSSSGSSTDSSGTSSDIDFFFALPIVVIGLVVTLADLVVQVIVLPFIVLARLVRLASWPVQMDHKDKYFRTNRTKGFGAAAALRDGLVEQIRAGLLPGRPLPEPPPTANAPEAPAAA